MIFEMSEHVANPPARTSLWTTSASQPTTPVIEAKVDTSVSAEKVRESVSAARRRGAVFATRLTEELLRKHF
jgi:hypothetical protein